MAKRTMVARFERNESGRDFVVGDIHGEFSLVRQALEAVGFDGSLDRLFCVGDLVDRGAECPEVLDFLAMPGVYAILGNHDDDLVSTARSRRAAVPKLLEMACREMGQTWWFELPAEQREAIVSAFEALPLAFEVSSAGGVVGIVHAEPVPGMAWALFVEKLEESDAAAMESCLWGREFAEGRAKGEIEGVWRVFGGHSPMVDGLGRFGNMYCVDTGAVFGRHGVAKDGHLTLARIDAPDLELISKRSGDGLVEIKGAELSPASRISRKAALE